MIREGIQKLIEGYNLTSDESGEIMREVMSGKATNSQTAAFLTALRIREKQLRNSSPLHPL
jgi:anthranilate phosphoribosyltransferase